MSVREKDHKDLLSNICDIKTFLWARGKVNFKTYASGTISEVKSIETQHQHIKKEHSYLVGASGSSAISNMVSVTCACNAPNTCVQ